MTKTKVKTVEISKKGEKDIKPVNERKIVKVDLISHSWRVVEKKKIGKVNYYLMQDYSGGKAKNLFNCIKESLDIGEKFTGRIIDVPDAKLTVEVERVKATGARGIKVERIEEPYYHRITDVGTVSDDEFYDVFGDQFAGVTLLVEKIGYKEHLFYKPSLSSDSKAT